jgi:hypothetical protein
MISASTCAKTRLCGRFTTLPVSDGWHLEISASNVVISGTCVLNYGGERTPVTTEIVEHSMAHRKAKSAASFGSGLGRQALVFDEDEVVRLLRTAVGQEGGQKAFAKRHGLDRTYVNMVLNGRAGLRDALMKALGLRKVYAAE